MSPEPAVRALEIFERVVDLSPDARSAILDAVSESDPIVARRVRAMLDADADPSALLDATPAELARSLGPDVSPLTRARIGAYTILGELGRGGMGVVYLAQREDVPMRVAIKVVTTEVATRERVARFHFERQVLARLEHPNIARLIDAGVTEDGTPWFAMEYVEGRPIDRHCDERLLSIGDRLALFEKVAGAVAYAHRNLVVHRDLKPSNVLVTPEGEPKLVDFGIAKLVASEAGEQHAEHSLTRDSGRVLTPEYASPEQFRGEAITTASDVYQLGILLHELLTGRRPRRDDGTPLNPFGVGAELEPARPSTVAPRRLSRQFSGNLDNIVLAALRAAPERRYPSAEQLMEDVRRHRAGLTILANPGPLRYRLARRLRRHRVATALSAVIAVLLTGLFAVTSAQSRRMARERDRAARMSDILESLLSSAGPSVVRDSSGVRPVLDVALQQARAGVAEEPEVWGPILIAIGRAFRTIRNFDQAAEAFRAATSALAPVVAPSDSVYLEGRSWLGTVLVERGDIAEGVRILESTLSQARRLPSERRAKLGASLVDLGFGRQVAGDDAAARKLYAEATGLLATLPDSGGGSFDRALVNMGYLASRLGDEIEAARLFRQASERRLARLGVETPATLNALSSLASSLLVLGDLDEADSLSRKVLEVRRRILPPTHSDVAGSLDVRARVLSALDHHDEAEVLMHEAIDIYRGVYHEPHLIVSYALSNLADVLREKGKLDDAAAIARQSVAQYTRAVGARHPGTLGATLNLADIERRRGNASIAESLFARALPPLDALDPARPGATRAVTNYAELLAATGRCDRAEALLRRALAMARHGWPSSHPNVLRVEHLLGDCLSARGAYAEAESLLVTALSDGRADTRLGVAIAAGVRASTVRLYQRWGKPEQAARYRR